VTLQSRCEVTNGSTPTIIPRLITLLVESQEVSMGKLTAEQKVREHNRGQKAASEGRSRSWSEPWAYPFESDQHYEERREAFNQGYGIIDATPMSIPRFP
jgi:hypothetical protein